MKINEFDTTIQPLLIAEIGNNHEGDATMARRLVRQAAMCGVHAVKFQTFRTELFANPADPARYERMKGFELTQDEFRELQELAKSYGLMFISTPLDLESAEFLAPLVDAFKIASGDNNFYPLLEVVADSGKPVIVSSGASDLGQILASKSIIENRWQTNGHEGDLAVLHCVSNYPVADEDAHLSAIGHLKQELNCTIGYSDHTLGVDACMLAVALGAEIIEKHFTLDHNYSEFRDHQLSADPGELKHLAEQIDRTQKMLGRSEKQVLENETEILPMIRRSIVAKRSLEEGHELTDADLMWLRPADGLAPGMEDELLGKTITRPINLGEPIQLKDVA